VRVSSSPLIELTSLAKLRREMVVACPVTTCSLSWIAVALSMMATSLWPAATGIVTGS